MTIAFTFTAGSAGGQHQVEMNKKNIKDAAHYLQLNWTDGGGSNDFTLGAAMVIQRLFLYVAIVFPLRPKSIIHTIPPYHKYTVIKLLGDIVDDDDSLEDKYKTDEIFHFSNF